LKTGKHVIFLGAGASKESGYPLANDLRLLISSRKDWIRALQMYDEKHGGALTDMGTAYWETHAEALDLFRNGGFATLDEFCKLAGPKFQSEVNGLRSLVRVALGLFNPEHQFEKSEYYAFIQALFKADLRTLREDVTVLTYNYDPYLEFLLHRALECREKINRRGKSPFMADQDVADFAAHSSRLNAVTSGLFSPENRNWLAGSGFCVLKLHGSICLVLDEVASFDTLFGQEGPTRAKSLMEGKARTVPAPLVFPWELMNEKGFVDVKSFPHGYNRDLYPLFTGIWERAKREVQAAEKISFVGLSMHAFLTDGLKYLFDGKEGTCEFVVANPDNKEFDPQKPETHWQRFPHTSASAVAQLLKSVAPKVKHVGRIGGRPHDGDLTLVNDFAEFIRTQMQPAVSFASP
jgi:hypothetical protein